jgi:monoterpene epsilon-lactone hydrolase
MKAFLIASLWMLATGSMLAQTPPQADSSFIDAKGTAHITRVVPVPTTVSPQAQKYLAQPVPDIPGHRPLALRRSQTDAWQARAGQQWQAINPVHLSLQTMAGVPVRVVEPLSIPASKRDRVLLNLHGGGFNSDSGSLTETIPIAYRTQTRVVAVLYRLAPEHPFPAAVDDSIAVYKELLKTYKPQKIAIYGTSAGAVLTPEVVIRLRQLGLPLPGALGVFSGFGDFSQQGDSRSLFALRGLSGHLDPPGAPNPDKTYMGKTNLKDPVLSPLYADLHGLPPTLFVTSERDMLLSGTTILHRAFLRAGDDARLVVFEGLPHAFWYDPSLPESQEANQIMADFFNRELSR